MWHVRTPHVLVFYALKHLQHCASLMCLRFKEYAGDCVECLEVVAPRSALSEPLAQPIDVLVLLEVVGQGEVVFEVEPLNTLLRRVVKVYVRKLRIHAVQIHRQLVVLIVSELKRICLPYVPAPTLYPIVKKIVLVSRVLEVVL
jgi:hypothetical protein